MAIILVNYIYQTDGEDDGQEASKLAAINTDEVRSFYARREPLVGTRIVFKNGSAMPVTERFDEVLSKINNL